MSIVTGRNKQMNEGVIPAARKTRGGGKADERSFD